MKTQSALHLFQYWNRLRNGAAAPTRVEIEPSDIRDVLSQTFILESDSQNEDMLFRLAGTNITNLFGRALKGAALRSLFQNQHKPIVSRLMRNCYQDKSVILLGLDAISRTGRQTLLEIMFLPLQDEASGHRILGCVTPHQYQFWHGLEPIIQIDLNSIRVVDPDREPLFLSNRPELVISPELAPTETQMHFHTTSMEKRGIQLTVIQGGKQPTGNEHVAITKR
jgi:hypothetical protein